MTRIVVAARAFAEWPSHRQIPFVPASPPLALASTALPVRALTMLAARANLGGPRETLLGVLQAARMVDGATGPYALSEPLRRSRAAAARSWLAALTMPAAARTAIGRTIDATAGNDRVFLASAWDAVVQLATPMLDMPSRSELRRLSTRLSMP